MSKIYDTYGFRFDDMAELSKIIGDILSIQFELRDSDFKGEYYQYGRYTQEIIDIVYNYNDYEEDWREREFTQYPLLLYVGNSKRSSTIEEVLMNHFQDRVILIRRKVLET